MKAPKIIIICIAIVMLFLNSLSARAAEFHDVTDADSFNSALISAASNNQDDTIYLDAGTYAGNFGPSSIEAYGLTIKPEDGLNPGQVVLDGKSSGRVLLLNASTGAANIVLEKLTITKGYLNATNVYGSGAYIKTGGTVNIIDCAVTENRIAQRGSQGAGIYIAATGKVTIQNSVINGNLTLDNDAFASALYIASASDLLLDQNIITNNSYNSYGAYLVFIVNVTSSIVMQKNNFSSNKTTIYISPSMSCNVTMTQNTISDNTVNGSFCNINIGANKTGIFTGNTVFNNTATAGSPFYFTLATGVTFVMTDNIIDSNTSGFCGGFLLNDAANTALTISGNTITSNKSTNAATSYIYVGGCSVYNSTSTSNLTFENNIIANNTSAGSYGGLYLTGGTIQMANNRITGNTAATSYGGAYIVASTAMKMVNNTVSGNSDKSTVGGVYLSAGSTATANVYNNIIWGNTSTSGIADVLVASAGTSIKGYNNNYHAMSGNWSSPQPRNDIDVDPLFISVSSGDYHLGTGSLCLNVGDNSAPGLPAKDLDNNTRICDAVVDLGAYEHCINECHPADADSNWIITQIELDNYAVAWKAGTAWPKAPNPIHIDYVTRCGYLQKLNSGNYENKGGGKPLCWESKP